MANKAAVVGVRVTTQHLLLQQLLASLSVIDNGTAAARGMLAPRTCHRNRNQAATTSASDRQKTSQWKRAGKNRSAVSDARRPRAVEPVAGAATTVGSSNATFSSLLYAHVTAMAAIWRLLRGLGATDDTFKRPSLELSRTNQSHGGQLKSYRSRTQPLPNVGEMVSGYGHLPFCPRPTWPDLVRLGLALVRSDLLLLCFPCPISNPNYVKIL